MSWSDPTREHTKWDLSGLAAAREATGDRYQLRELLGEGSSGRVYAALDTVLGHEVALKTLKRLCAEDSYRLKKEFRSLVDVVHPNLVRLHDLVVTPDKCFFTMELIRGLNFIAWARECLGDDMDSGSRAWDRFRSGLVSLVRGIDALHRLGRIHRDIKPTNVLVAREDRVVVVDVGLVSRLESHQSEVSRSRSFAGTLNYMAPEQAWGGNVAPASDWYSVGVVLFEALTGRLPFQPTTFRGFEPHPRLETQLDRRVPPELASLALDLLSPDLRARPSSDAILRRLGVADQIVVSGNQNFFTGRIRELERLRDASARVDTGSFTFIHIRGPAGIGKTALLDSFLGRTTGTGSLVTLRARCHYREHVSFNALDGLFDDLSRYLSSLSDVETEALTPSDLPAMLQAFPVLRRVPVFERLCPHAPHTAQDVRLRDLAFRALRELLGRIAQRTTLLLCIDDVQRIDGDSLVFLRTLEPKAGGRLVLIYLYRDDTGFEPVARVLAESMRPGVQVEDLQLGPLGSHEIHELAARILPNMPQGIAETVLQASHGNPAFTISLCSAIVKSRVAITADTTFEELTTRQLAILGDQARHALRLICAAARPLGQRALSQALNVGNEVMVELQCQGLARQSLVSGRLCWEPTDSRVRNAVFATLDADVRDGLHHSLIELYRSDPNPDPHDLLELLIAGGRGNEEAVEMAVRAARDSAARGAFASAVALYRRALDLAPLDGERWRLQMALGDALAHCGQARQAAEQLLAAATAIAQRPDLEHITVRLRIGAGQRLLLSGYWNEGFEMVHAALRAVDTPYARSAAGSLVKAALQAPAVILAKRRWQARRSPAPPISESVRLRLDIVWAAGLSIAWMDPMRAVELSVRHAILAYDAGDVAHVARTKTARAIVLAMQGGPRRWRLASELQADAQRLGESCGDASVETLVAVYSALVEYFQGHFRDAARLCERGIELAYQKGIGLVPELGLAQWTYLNCLAYMGELQEVRARIQEYLLAADARDERLITSSYRVGWINLASLTTGSESEAQKQHAQALSAYQGHAFNSIHYLALISGCNLALYSGDYEAAWREVDAAWPALKRSMQLSIAAVSAEMYDVRGRAALANGMHGAPGRHRAYWLAEASRCAARLRRNPVPAAQPFAAALAAGIAFAERRTEVGSGELERARVGFERAEMSLHASVCSLWLATHSSGPRAAELEEAGYAMLRAQHVEQPDRLACVLLPGYVRELSSV